jgi:hypothetical protein
MMTANANSDAVAAVAKRIARSCLPCVPSFLAGAVVGPAGPTRLAGLADAVLGLAAGGRVLCLGGAAAGDDASGGALGLVLGLVGLVGASGRVLGLGGAVAGAGAAAGATAGAGIVASPPGLSRFCVTYPATRPSSPDIASRCARSSAASRSAASLIVAACWVACSRMPAASCSAACRIDVAWFHACWAIAAA